eukprot:jgi/Botrbrau1/17853/Bobra.0127s0093.1
MHLTERGNLTVQTTGGTLNFHILADIRYITCADVTTERRCQRPIKFSLAGTWYPLDRGGIHPPPSDSAATCTTGQLPFGPWTDGWFPWLTARQMLQNLLVVPLAFNSPVASRIPRGLLRVGLM